MVCGFQNWTSIDYELGMYYAESLRLWSFSFLVGQKKIVRIEIHTKEGSDFSNMYSIQVDFCPQNSNFSNWFL